MASHNKLSIIAYNMLLLMLLCICFLVACAPKVAQPPQSAYIVSSWYGPDFHGKPTASGERYNMYAMTCAHREYPFGTKLRVTNTENDKSTICVVNDRGPFIAGRDLDLSYAAAKQIGLIGPGTAKVRIDYLGRDMTYVKDVKYSGARGPYTIQVGSFKEAENASRLKSALDLKYSGTYITEATVKGTSFYRVRIGKFSDRNDASKLAKALADEGYHALVTGYEEKI
jgi:rare lipoprotein A